MADEAGQRRGRWWVGVRLASGSTTVVELFVRVRRSTKGAARILCICTFSTCGTTLCTVLCYSFVERVRGTCSDACVVVQEEGFGRSAVYTRVRCVVRTRIAVCMTQCAYSKLV